jgi:LysM repeat protein
MKKFYILLFTAMYSLLTLEVSLAKSKIVADPYFENRLIENKTYYTVKGDTLEKIAFKLYSHKSWAQKITQENPLFEKFGLREKLPLGIKLSYKGEPIPNRYIVQERDIIYRLITWKWGSFEKWEQEVKNSSMLLKSLRKIKVGDTLIFDENKSITHIPTSKLPELGINEEWKFYETNAQDTMRIVAFRTYGKKSWWYKIKVHNRLQLTNPYQKIGAGTRLVYIGPKLNDHYQIKSGDTLSRVALWKFGDTGKWKEVYKFNKEKIKDPNLIYPGDYLVFEGKTIQHMRPAVVTTKTIVKQPKVEKIVAKPIVSQKNLPRKISSTKPNESNQSKWILLFVLMALLSGFLLYLWKDENGKFKALSILKR